VLSGEVTNTNLMVFFVTRPRLETTIYRTWGEHANHYATDAVKRETMEIAKKMREKKRKR
jgi:hypothetical protein